MKQIKGKTVFVAGSGKDLHVFESKEVYEQHCQDYGRTFKCKEVEMYERLDVVCVEKTGSAMVPYTEQLVCESVGRLSDVVCENERDIDFKCEGSTWRFLSLAEVDIPIGAWQWYIKRPDRDERLWESKWVVKKQ